MLSEKNKLINEFHRNITSKMVSMDRINWLKEIETFVDSLMKEKAEEIRKLKKPEMANYLPTIMANEALEVAARLLET